MIRAEFLANKNGGIQVFDICNNSKRLKLTNEVCELLFADMSIMSNDHADKLCRIIKQQGVYVGIIYCYTNFDNGKKYIGQTINPHQRFKAHRASSSKDKNSIWHKVLKRYGIEKFYYHLLSIVITDTKDELRNTLNFKEDYYIKLMRSSVKEWGYNVAQGGTYHNDTKSIEKAVDMFDLQGNFIKTFNSITDAKNEFNFSGPTIRQVCNHIYYIAGNHLWAWHGEKPILPPSSKIYSYDLDGNFVAEYKNCFVAGKVLGVSCASISKAITEKHRIAYGYYWRKEKYTILPMTEYPKAIYAFDKNGCFNSWYKNYADVIKKLGVNSSTELSHAIHSNKKCAGFYWRGQYQENIEVPIGDRLKRVSVLAIMPDKTVRKYTMIKEAAKDLNINTSVIHHSLKTQHKTQQGIMFQRI